MANHVLSTIYFHNFTDEALEAMTTIGDVDHIIGMYGKSLDDVDRDWMEENIGAKWVTVDESDDESIHLTSAWSAPHPFCSFLLDYVAEHYNCKNHGVFMVFEDEMPNFIGVYGVAANGYEVDLVLSSDEDYEETLGCLPYSENDEDEDAYWDTKTEWADAVSKWFSKEEDSFISSMNIPIETHAIEMSDNV